MTEANSKPKFAGMRIVLGEREFILPSLSTAQARERWEDLQLLDEPGDKANSKQRIQKAVEIIHLALTRNYPDLKFEEVDSLVGLADAIPLVSMLSQTSGLGGPGGQPAGVEDAAGREKNLIGPSSTEQSSPAPAGPTTT